MSKISAEANIEVIKEKLKKVGFRGDIDDSNASKDFYSHDASLFEIRPQLIVAPRDVKDVAELISVVAANKAVMPELSVTARSAGTDMSGGAINDSIIVDFAKYFTKIGRVNHSRARTQPGVMYETFEKETLKYNALMPSYPASRFLCTVGGMVNNNSGGEKSLEFGKTANFVTELQFVFADGIERTVRPLTRQELDKKMAQKDFEGKVYRELFELLENNYDQIKASKPKVSKDSTGYHLWDVWDRETQMFDLTKLIVGAQGTVGFTTDIEFKLERHRPHSGLLVLFLKDIGNLGELINVILSHKPATFESFDDATLLLSIKFMPYFLKLLGPAAFIKLCFGLLPDAFQLLHGIPKLVLMVEFNGESEDEVRHRIARLHKELGIKRAYYEINGFEETPTEGKSEKFWIVRRQSFNILRKKVKDKHTAPFIDDLIVNPSYLPEFLPRLRAIIKKYKLFATIAGHMGDGNFHIIPLMKLEDPKERAKLLPAMKEVDELVLQFHGSLSGEHNDGLIRGPWLEQMYGKDMLDIFKQAKYIMDPDNIFNPHKKADAQWDYSYNHIRDHF